MAGDIEVELEAIKTLQQTLEPLAPEVRARVLDYVFRVLDIPRPAQISGASNPPAQPTPPASTETIPSAVARPMAHSDILSLKHDKQPSSANQMIALVAYYLAYEAPEDEKKNAISADDVKKYFVQGRYPLPSSPGMALTHARHAGYLDPVDRGTYRLNSVGYNLVAHKMGAQGETANSTPKPRKGGKR